MKQVVAGLAVVFVVLGLGFAFLVASGRRSASRPPTTRSTERIATISHGQRVTIEEHLGPELTVVEFYADW